MRGDLTRPWVSLPDRENAAQSLGPTPPLRHNYPTARQDRGVKKRALANNKSSLHVLCIECASVFVSACVSWVLVCECVYLTVAGVVSGHPAGMCSESAFHSWVQKIMKGQSSRARHNEGWESSEERVEKQTTTIFILVGSHIKYE